MGFVVNDDTFKLSFKDSRYAGMEVEVAGLDMQAMIDVVATEGAHGVRSDQFIDSVGAQFLRSLVNWNLEYVDRKTDQVLPLPRTTEGLKKLRPDQWVALYRAWMSALTGVGSDDLGKDSSSGGPSLAELPMTEPSSPNPSS